MKAPQDKILQFLSCECISSYVQLIYNLYAASVNGPKTVPVPTGSSCKTAKKQSFEHKDANMVYNDELVELEAFNFFSQFKVWLENLIQDGGLELHPTETDERTQDGDFE